MPEEKMREEFEAWVKRKWPDTYLEKITAESGAIYSVGNYIEPHAQFSWVAWQASRSAIEVNLGQRWSLDAFEGGWTADPEGASLDYSATVEAIEMLGLKVTP